MEVYLVDFDWFESVVWMLVNSYTGRGSSLHLDLTL